MERDQWNVELPAHVERDVLRALYLPNPEDRIESVANRYPEIRKQIHMWANQAREFDLVQTATLPRHAQSEHLDSAPDVPEQIGSYKILTALGQGGFGSVFLAEHRDSGAKHAVKVLNRQGPGSRQYIRQEFELLSTLDHPSIVEVHEYGFTKHEQPYYSMDYVSGLPLDATFGANLYSNDDLIATLLQTCDSLSYVHRRSLVHRDVKPQNIMVDNDVQRPRAYLVDFGLAAIQSQRSVAPGQLRMVKARQLLQQTLFTSEGAVVGTPGFMAPEQFLGKLDARSDIYAFGVTVYLMLTGRFPIEPDVIMSAWNQSPKAAFDTMMSTDIVKPTAIGKVDLEEVRPKHRRSIGAPRLTCGLGWRQQKRVNVALLKALNSDPGMRYKDIGELGEELAVAFGYVASGFLMQCQRIAKRIFPLPFLRRRTKQDDPHNARVWFVTDRAPVSSATLGHHFGTTESDSLAFGYSVVQQPLWKSVGKTKPRWRDWLRSDTGYVVLRNEIIDREEFETSLRFSRDRPGLLLIVHGFNTTFAEAIIRAAQFQADLKMSEQIICYSWPSQGSPLRYGVDVGLVEESEPNFRGVLELLTSVRPDKGLHILAHSMGNRLVLKASHSFAQQGRTLALGQLILAAPDVSQRRFRQLSVAYDGAQRKTIYASKHDRALMGSRFLHARGRVGYIPPIMIVDNIDTIDASAHGYSLWGLNHSGYGDCRELVTDIGTLIRQDLAPELRIGLDRRLDPVSGKVYWVCF